MSILTPFFMPIPHWACVCRCSGKSAAPFLLLQSPGSRLWVSELLTGYKPSPARRNLKNFHAHAAGLPQFLSEVLDNFN